MLKIVSMENNVYFMPGDIVTIRLDIPNKPTMIVKCKKTSRFTPNKEDAGKNYLEGISCIWFDTESRLQEATFNTKDLILI